jgi:hypothetical protein
MHCGLFCLKKEDVLEKGRLQNYLMGNRVNQNRPRVKKRDSKNYK